jgi:fructose-1,6-bisphosphatase/inositol monophosphatase family enzyme
MPRPVTDTPDIDAVTRLIEQVASEVVVPKFRALRDDEVLHKETAGYADDVVTVVDRDAEARLAEGLTALFPAARVIGEEAAHAEPGSLRLIESDEPLWIVDPLDGTHNFANGHDGFGMMVGFVVGGQVRAGWVYLPLREEFFVAAAGAGAYMNGSRMHVPDRRSAERPRGTFLSRFMPPDVRDRVTTRLADHVTPATQSGAAAVEYTDVLRGRREFVAYYRLLPWDHGAPGLILTEGGGAVEHLDGRPYTVRSTHQVTLVARDAELAGRLRNWINGEHGGSSQQHP